MEYEQLKQPNLSIIGSEGLCLVYVREVFNVPAKYGTATIAWNNAQYRYSNQEPPNNISVPIWFSYNGPDGHVAVWHNGVIYSTSAQGDKTFTNIPELVSWMGEGFVYLGWSEDLNGERVVEPIPTPTPPLAPAPVVPVVIPPPAAPVPVPGNSEATYEVITTILGFSSATDAGNHTNAKGTVQPGTYYVFNTYTGKDNLKNLTKIVGKAGSWVNTDDNVIPVIAPEPTPVTDETPDPNTWKTGYVAYKDTSGNLTPEQYVIMFSQTPITNADTGQSLTISKNKNGEPSQYEPISIAGTVTKDGIAYLRPQNNNADKGLWWLIPEHDAVGRQYLMLESDVYNAKTSTAERVALKNTKFVDNFVRLGAFLSNMSESIKKKL